MGKLFDNLTKKLDAKRRPYCAALVAAAGCSSRMGGTDKLTAPLCGVPVLVRTLTAQLYFPDESGTLTVEERLLTQYEGQSAADVVLSALADGPSQEGLQPLLPEEFTGLTARVEDGVCQLNMLSASVEDMDSAAVRQMLQGVMSSLQSLEGVSAVQLYVDGVYADAYE